MKKHALNAYQSSLDVEVNSASPHKLVLMLFDGAIQAIRQAEFHLEPLNLSEKGRLIGKAISIIDEGLRGALRHEDGGELAANLDALYEYCSYTLLQANLNNDALRLQEVAGLLSGLREAWSEIPKEAQYGHTSAEVAIRHGSI